MPTLLAIAMSLVFVPLQSAHAQARIPILGAADRDLADMPVKPIDLYPSCFLKLDGSQNCYPAVIAGQRAYQREAPWQAQIFETSARREFSEQTLREFPLWELNHFCGGALIADNWILTAAHCVVNSRFTASRFRVRLGSDDISVDDGRTFVIDRTVHHALYDAQTSLNDIALIRIKTQEGFPRDLSAKISPIELHGASINGPRLLPWQPFQVTGWGVTGDGHASPLLQKLWLERVPTPLCIQALNAPTKINDSVLCAISNVGDTCQGDSGGPLTVSTNDARSFNTTRVLVGIVSWGRGCAVKGNPGVYTRVSAHLDWIRRAMASPDTVTSLR